MHELGVVFKVIERVERLAAEQDLPHICTVSLDLGEVSTVIPSYLTDCWKWAVRKSDVLRGAKLEIREIPAVTVCGDCGGEYPTVKYGKTCPHCGSGNTWLVRGNEFIIREVEADVPGDAGTEGEE